MLVPKTALETPPLEIHTLGDDVLRQPARRIGKVTEQTRELARDMLRSMYTAKGIGLAAPQVGIHQQLLVIDLDLENAATPPLVLINPEITGQRRASTPMKKAVSAFPAFISMWCGPPRSN